MASAREITTEQPLSYNQWKDQQFDSYFPGGIGFSDAGAVIGQGLGYAVGAGRYSRKNYNEYYNNFVSSKVNTPESAKIESMSEREFSKYMTEYAHQLGIEADSKKYQRAYNDILAAGLNPRLALESLSGSNVGASSAYSASENRSESKSNSFSSSAVIAAILTAAGLVIKSML